VNYEPANTEWRGILAYSYTLRGQVLLDGKQPEKAYDDFQRALVIREELCSANTNDLALRERLAASHTWLGWCARELGRAQDTLEHYERAYDITEALFATQPDVTQRALDVIRSKTNLAIGHMEFDTPERNEIAAALLTEAAASLEALRDSGKLAVRSGTYDSWIAEIQAKLADLANRTQRGAQLGPVLTSPQDRQALPTRER